MIKPHKNRQDLTGHRFGSVIAISLHGSVNGRVKWNCVCDCGKEFSVFANNLKRIKSCGCAQGRGVIGSLRTSVFNDYKFRSKKKGLKFELDFGQFEMMIALACYYCGSPPDNSKKRYSTELVYSGLDRIDNFKGYAIGNVVPCCVTCNVMKMRLTQKEFAQHVEKIYANYVNKDLRNE